ncbi:hypothetical protein [Sphaerisporangium rhizosphaerae]|uniref:Apea-like HEPN domain-containing protein n=1 Tax=Sphaerisporangium rhizosphaerae TaxID=2269375 RepID=A0ABW2P3X4_9ACTN
MAKKSVAPELHVGQVDDEELRIVLGSILPRCAQFRTQEVEYRTQNDDWALSLHYRNGKIVDATAGPAMTSEIKSRMQEAIEREILSPSDKKIVRWTMFSGKPVEGQWRHGGGLRIVPAPVEAPRPEELMAEHPFIVDITFRGSSNFVIEQMRYVRRARELALLFNLFLSTRITSSTNSSRKHWVLVRQGSTVASTWANEGYFIPKFTYIVDDFPVDDSPPLAEVESNIYYSTRSYAGDTLAIPAEFSRLLDIFSTLGADARDRYMRACYWYHTAATVWDYSKSLYFTSLINAIECVAGLDIDRSSQSGVSPDFRPSTLFKTFMQKFAPGEPSGAQLDRIYEARSEITHGERLLVNDGVVASWGLDQTSAKDRDISENARILCRAALINWLWSSDSTSEGLLISAGVEVVKPPPPGTKSGVIVFVPDSQ